MMKKSLPVFRSGVEQVKKLLFVFLQVRQIYKYSNSKVKCEINSTKKEREETTN